MSIQLDLSKVSIFRNFAGNNEDAIANLDGDGAIKANGTYTGMLGAEGFYAAAERFVSTLESWLALIANFRPVFEAAPQAETKAPYFGMDGFVQV